MGVYVRMRNQIEGPHSHVGTLEAERSRPAHTRPRADQSAAANAASNSREGLESDATQQIDQLVRLIYLFHTTNVLSVLRHVWLTDVRAI